MTPVAQIPGCSACFNKNAAPAAAKPSIPVHEMCACYRPKVTMG